MQRRPVLVLLAAAWPARRAAADAAAPEASLALALRRAHELRDAAVRAGDQPYGAVVFDGRRVVGEAESRVVQRGNADAHAEREALADAQRRLGRSDLGGLLLVSSSRPCALCEAAAARVGIARMIWGRGEDAGAPRLR